MNYSIYELQRIINNQILRMGTKDFEQFYTIKLVIQLVISLCLIVWTVRKFPKTRYHTLVAYLASATIILSIVGAG
jgi:hypothetical protein